MSKTSGVDRLKEFNSREDGSGKKKKRSFREKIEQMPLSIYVCISLGLIIIYSIVELIISTITEISHDTLTTCFYAVFGGEVVSCALIKIFKLKEEGDPDNYDE